VLTSVPTRPVLSTARTASSDNIARLRAIIDEDIDEAEAHGLEMPLYCKHGWLLAIRTPCWSCDSAPDSPAVLRNMLWGEYDDALQEREEREDQDQRRQSGEERAAQMVVGEAAAEQIARGRADTEQREQDGDIGSRVPGRVREHRRDVAVRREQGPEARDRRAERQPHGQ